MMAYGKTTKLKVHVTKQHMCEKNTELKGDMMKHV